MESVETMEFRQIPLTRGLFATVDAKHYDWLMRFNWHAVEKSGCWYASAMVEHDGDVIVIEMHKLIMGVPDNIQVDHKNGNGIDNREINLRICTQANNLKNKTRYRNKKNSDYKGVFKTKNKNKPYMANIQNNRKRYYLGVFATQDEAARAYDKAAIELHGEFACLNFPQEGRLQNSNHNHKALPKENTVARKRKRKTSKYWGVMWLTKPQKWIARYTKHGEHVCHIGTFKDEVRAAKAFDNYCRSIGEISRLNFPEVTEVIEPDTVFRKRRHSCASKYMGVSWNSKTKKWMATVCLNGKTKIFSPYYDTEAEAAKRHDEYCREHGLHEKINGVA